MKERLNSICPIFLKNKDTSKIEQIGSGVLVNFLNSIYLLTVAHVTDELTKGYLLIPTTEGLSQLYGHYCTLEVPKGISREDDKIDIAYFKLTKEFSNIIDPAFYILERNDINLTESLFEDDIYTFGGYPWRKAELKNGVFASKLITYTGTAPEIDTYNKLDYHPSTHIIINFNRKKTLNNNDEKIIAPHPQGISGGGIFCWPKDTSQNVNTNANINLVGIGHTYIENKHCMIGTRINLYLSCIIHNNPAVIKDVGSDKVEKGIIPMVTGIAIYKKDEWPRLKAEFCDTASMSATWDIWRHKTEVFIEQSARAGKVIYPIPIEAAQINDYCRNNNIPNTSRARCELVSKIVASKIFETKL